MKRKVEKPLEGWGLLFGGLQGGEVFPQKRKVFSHCAAQSLAGGVTVAGKSPIAIWLQPGPLSTDDGILPEAAAVARSRWLALEQLRAGW